MKSVVDHVVGLLMRRVSIDLLVGNIGIGRSRMEHGLRNSLFGHDLFL